MKTKVKLPSGEIGYISGYSGLDAIVIVGTEFHISNINNLEIVTGKKKKQKIWEETSIEYRLAKLMFNSLKLMNPDYTEPNLHRWADDMDLIVRVDKKLPEEVVALMRCIYNDNFEMTVVLSPAKLRKRYKDLALKFLVKKKVIEEKKQIAQSETLIFE
jgi:hypothetical protein